MDAIRQKLAERVGELTVALAFITARAGKIGRSHFRTQAEYECWCEAYDQARAALANTGEK